MPVTAPRVLSLNTIPDIEQRVCENLKRFRKSCGLSQKELAEKLDVSFQQVQKYENGINRISAGKLHELSNIFDLPISIFFSENPADDLMSLTLKQSQKNMDDVCSPKDDFDIQILAKLKLLSSSKKKMVLKFMSKISEV